MPRTKSVTESAKKRASKARFQRFRSKFINLGDETDRWNNLKSILGTDEDCVVAKTLIECYLETHAGPTIESLTVKHSVGTESSTPMHGHSHQVPPDPGLSSLSEGSDTPGELSGIGGGISDFEVAGPSGISFKRKSTTAPDKPTKVKIVEKATERKEVSKRTARVEVDWPSSGMEDIYDPDYDPDDPTYHPTDFDLSIVQSDDEAVDEAGVVDAVFDIDCDDDFEDDSQVIGSEKPLDEVTEEDMIEDKYIVSRHCLNQLLDMLPFKHCSKCGKTATHRTKTVGCTIIVIWTCEDGHVLHRWQSSAVLPNGMFINNFQASASILLSGNNYEKVRLFVKFLGLKFPSQTSFHRVQNKYAVPVVNQYWSDLRASVAEEHRAVSIVVSGDGRMDSPGYCAKYCTYTVMNQEDKKIFALEVVDKRETDLKSGLMEAKGFAKAMATLQADGIELKEIVTDAHPQISAIMRKSYPKTRHSYDMWHGAKNLGKKLSSIALAKGNEALKPWLKDITNHFFHSAETCGGNALEMKTKWLSVINHVTNRHTWALGQCDHEPIVEDERDLEEKQWLKPASMAVKDLQKTVMEPRLLKTFPYYVTCQTTSELEMFNNHLLMYAPKRNAFGYAGYKCRCQLAAIDYTHHVDRQTLVDKDGKTRVRRVHSKAANNWTVVPVKEKKQYKYIPGLLSRICMEYIQINKENPLRSKFRVDPDDPKKIASTIAQCPPPPTAELRETKRSRIKVKQASKKFAD